MSKKSDIFTLRNLTISTGIVGPIIFVYLFVVLGIYYPDYNHLVQLVSELGVAGTPTAFFFNTVGFMFFGILVMIFAYGIYKEIEDGIGIEIGSILIFLCGLSLFFLGIFPCDVGCVNVTNTGIMHTIFNRIAIFCAISASLVIALRFRQSNRWKRYARFSVMIGIASAIAWFIFFFVPVPGYAGAIQKTAILISLIWVEVISLSLLRFYRK